MRSLYLLANVSLEYLTFRFVLLATELSEFDFQSYAVNVYVWGMHGGICQ